MNIGPHPLSRQRLSFLLGALCSTVAIPVAATPAQSSLQAASPSAYIAAAKPARTVLGRHDSREFIEVKFRQDQPVRVRSGRLSAPTLGTAAISRLENVLSQHVVADIEPLFHVASERSLQQLAATAEQRSGRVQSDLNQWYRVRVQPGADIVDLVNQLNALDSVEIAYPAPTAAPSPRATGVPRRERIYPSFITADYTAQQGYAAAASLGGVDALYARGIAGGDGAGIRLVDIEYEWNTGHEDLSQLRAADAWLANGTPKGPFNDNNHGTAVVGQIAADDNGFGVTGLVPGVKVHITNANNTERGYDLANSVIRATQALAAGDVILLEQQTSGPPDCNGYVAVEQIWSVYDAIVAATSLGIHVVEAAGNGAENLDNASCFGSPFPVGRPDSGAIIVGAGSAPGCSQPPRARLGFSSYGSRVDLQGWGECVVTTGYGSLAGTTPNQYYANGFSGTSSASPIVASAVASLSGIAKQRGLTLTPQQMRQLLVDTGTPQNNLSGGKIGPLPNLRAAIDALGGGNELPLASFGFTASGLTVSFTDGSTDPDGSIASRSWDFGDGTGSTAAHPSRTYAAAGTYSVALTVTDNDGGVDTVVRSVTVGGSNVLSNGVPVTGLAAATGQSLAYTIEVPANASNLVITTAGGTGDADLYVKAGSAPTDGSYDCRPYKAGSNETCTIPAPVAGTYHVRVKAYSGFSGLSLTGTYSVGSPVQTYSNDSDVSIPNNATVESPVTVGGRSGNAPADAQVQVDIIHTYIGDLKVELVAPDGSTYVLHDRAGYSADNIHQTYTVNLASEPLNGTWKLRVNDNYQYDSGYIDRWSITF